MTTSITHTICSMKFPTDMRHSSMAISQSICRKPLPFFSIFTKTHSISSSPSTISEGNLVSAAVSILKHHRSKSRWSQLRSLLTNNPLTPFQFSQISLQLRNNPHLALNFFNFTLQHSLCSHSLSSYSTVVHILSRSRLRSQALSLIKSAMCAFPQIHGENSVAILEELIRSYRDCDSAPFVFDLLVRACLESKKIDLAIRIYEMLRSKNVFLRTSTCNSLIELVSRSRGCFAGHDLCRKIFDLDVDNESRNVRDSRAFFATNANTFNVVMVGFHREGLVDKVEEVWEEMERVGCVPNVYSFNVLMAAYCDDGRMEDAMRVWKEMENKGLKHDVVAYNTIIGGFCGVGEVAKAEEIYREMVMGGVETTSITFEQLINGYCEIGDADSALLLCENMCSRSFTPQSSTVNVIIRRLCDDNRVTPALEFWRKAVKKHKAIMEKENYVSLITGLCRDGEMEDALKLQAEMVRNGFEPNSDLYNMFIDGYMKQGNETWAIKLRKEMLSKEIS